MLCLAHISGRHRTVSTAQCCCAMLYCHAYCRYVSECRAHCLPPLRCSGAALIKTKPDPMCVNQHSCRCSPLVVCQKSIAFHHLERRPLHVQRLIQAKRRWLTQASTESQSLTYKVTKPLVLDAHVRACCMLLQDTHSTDIITGVPADARYLLGVSCPGCKRQDALIL